MADHSLKISWKIINVFELYIIQWSGNFTAAECMMIHAVSETDMWKRPGSVEWTYPHG